MTDILICGSPKGRATQPICELRLPMQTRIRDPRLHRPAIPYQDHFAMSQRNRFLVDPDVQLAIIRRMIMHWALAVLALISIGVSVQLLYAPGDQSFADAIKSSFGAQAPLLTIMFILMPVYIWDVIKLTHRFAGPILRLRNIFRDLANGGRAPRLRFRPGDYWQGIADDFNSFYESHVALQERCDLLEKELARANGSSPTLDSVDA